MKIAYFIGALNRGGAESLILDVCREHEHVPYEFLCIYRHEGNMSEAFKETGAYPIQVNKRWGFLRYLCNIRRTLQQQQVTIVHSQTPSNTLLLSFALMGTGIKIITTFHGYNFCKAPWWQRYLVYHASSKILCVSQHQKQYYERLWNLPEENKLEVVYNGIDFAKFDSVKSIVESVKYKVESGRMRLCMVGNFVSVRSQKLIIAAIHRLKEKGIADFDFYFVGRRDEKEAWRYDECVQYSQTNHLENVHFLGSRGDVPEFLKSMDGFVYSTAHDTFGIAVIEAIAAGLPIVVNDWPVMTEVCDLDLPESNNAIRFYKTEDVEDCAEKIAELLDKLHLCKEKLSKDCKSASEAARKKYSIEMHIERLNEIYSSTDN